MIVDGRQLPTGHEIRTEVCVVGAGVAGITLVRELTARGLDVVLLEAGGNRHERATQDLYKGEMFNKQNHGALHLYRRRQMGGTSTVWGGRCGPYETIDFTSRPYVQYSGWPISRDTLEPYYRRAHEYLELGDFSYRVTESLPVDKQLMVPRLAELGASIDTLWRFSPPTNFKNRYFAYLKDNDHVTVYLHANCLKIVTNQDGLSVDHILASSLRNNRFRVYARQFVLAAGGLETTRILLASNDIKPCGLGNDYDLLGRFYMSHVTGDAGRIRFSPKYASHCWNYDQTADGVYCRRKLSVREDVQRAQGLLNFSAMASPAPPYNPSHGSAILSGVYLAKRILRRNIPPEFSRELSLIPGYQHFWKHVKNVVLGVGELIGFSKLWVRKRILAKRKLPSVCLENEEGEYTLHFDAEQSPNPSSRVLLGQEKDPLGMPRLCVDWKLSSIDVDSVVRSVDFLKSAVAEAAIGSIEVYPGLHERIRAQTSVGSHHIGTTRMGSTPQTGVVDPNCRVYGVHNLYVASPSVFPTSSYVNPTLTIAAVAIRVADHLAV